MVMELLFIYLVCINVVTFFLYGADKWKAKKGKSRISEKCLLCTAVFGGSVGGLVGMYTFRHKTKKAKFYLGVPAILALQAALAAVVYYSI